jgi:Icc protein
MDDAIVHLLQVTDMHLVADAEGEIRGVRGYESFARVLAAARSGYGGTWPPAAVLATGDLSDDGSPESYRHFRALVADLGARVHWIPGNHDEPRTMLEVLPGGNVSNQRAFTAGGWQVVMLDSHLPGEVKGRLGPRELDFLDRRLTNNGARHALVCLHHNPCGIGSRWFEPLGIDDAEALWQVIERHPQVRCVLFAHIHQAFEAQRGDVRLLATPSASAQFAPGTDTLVIDDLPPGWRTLQLHGDGSITSQVHRLPA